MGVLVMINTQTNDGLLIFQFAMRIEFQWVIKVEFHSSHRLCIIIIIINFIHPSGKLKLSFDRTTKKMSQ